MHPKGERQCFTDRTCCLFDMIRTQVASYFAFISVKVAGTDFQHFPSLVLDGAILPPLSVDAAIMVSNKCLIINWLTSHGHFFSIIAHQQ